MGTAEEFVDIDGKTIYTIKLNIMFNRSDIKIIHYIGCYDEEAWIWKFPKGQVLTAEIEFIKNFLHGIDCSQYLLILIESQPCHSETFGTFYDNPFDIRLIHTISHKHTDEEMCSRTIRERIVDLDLPNWGEEE